jgi:hypothetical protein
VAERVTLPLRIQDVPVSNIGPETGHPHWGFSWFSSLPQYKSGIVPYIRPQPLPATSFPIHHFIPRYTLIPRLTLLIRSGKTDR